MSRNKRARGKDTSIEVNRVGELVRHVNALGYIYIALKPHDTNYTEPDTISIY